MSGAVSLWRIAAETRQYSADDLSGAGAARHPGRWNAPGEHVVYCATSLALAVLETAAHLDDRGLPLNRFVIEVTVPAEIWKKRVERDPSSLDPGWRAIPCGKASVDIGSAWYKSGSSALLLLPSVVVEEERIVLINASHPDASQITARKLRPYDYNRLFRSGGGR